MGSTLKLGVVDRIYLYTRMKYYKVKSIIYIFIKVA